MARPAKETLMGNFAERLTQQQAWAGLLMGNHALVRAMLESGVMVATTYPGSPTPEIADAILTIPEKQRAMHFEFSVNEKVALETAFGASINGHLSTVFFKSVGLNVALDSAVQLSLLDLHGGLVIILGDDPGANSSQNEQDNRHTARLGYMPMFEPATPGEAYRMFKEAAALSQKLKLPIILRMTTHVCHAREVVQFAEIPHYDYDWTPRFVSHGLDYWPITANVFPLKRKALARLAAVAKYAETSPSTAEYAPNGSAPIDGRRLGVIVCSLPATALAENLEQSTATLDVLKLGLSYPWPRQRVLDFLKGHDEVLLIEELDRILEYEIKSLVLDEGVPVKIHARTDNEQLMREYTSDRTWELLSQTWPQHFAPRLASPQYGE
jgi:indolepyruvate ferredoxin oxidoreductase, alpha subunit